MTATANSLNKEFGYLFFGGIINQRSFISYLTLYMYTKNECTVTWILVPITLYSLCRSKLKEHMQYCVDHPEEISKLAKVKAQVSEVKGVMMENIEKV